MSVGTHDYFDHGSTLIVSIDSLSWTVTLLCRILQSLRRPALQPVREADVCRPALFAAMQIC